MEPENEEIYPIQLAAQQRFLIINKAFHIYKEREPFPSPQEPPNDLFVSKRVTIPRTSVKIAVVSFFSEVLCFKRGT